MDNAMTPNVLFDWKPVIMGILLVMIAVPVGFAQDEAGEQAVYPVAILPFVERQKKSDETGKIISDILFANLAVDPAILLVDREDLDKMLEEQGMNISGIVDSANAAKVGNIIGAKILVTGSIFKVESTQYIVAKIIGTETTRVFGTSVKGSDKEGLDTLAEKLSEDVGKIILKEARQLVAQVESRENRIARLKDSISGKTLPSLAVTVSERHVGRQTVDPAAETEMNLFATETGFAVFVQEKQADILIQGEAFSEYTATHGKLIAVKARVEVKAVDATTGKIIATDRQTTVAVDLTEQIAGKTALQQAGALLAERIIPKIVK